jgi:7-carboxy-7-deazaguanine synthase
MLTISKRFGFQPRLSSMNDRIRISEIFGPTIQGEGPLIGTPSVFVRTAGCDYRCTWCDTLHAVLPQFHEQWRFMTADEVMARVDELAGRKPILVSLSGGNPALQPLAPLIALGRQKGHTFALETQGSISQHWFNDLSWLILSPKPPSSKFVTDWAAVEACLAAAKEGPSSALKIVVFDDEDYAYALEAAARFPMLPTYFQVGNSHVAENDDISVQALMERFRWLAGKVVEDGLFNVNVLPQLHVLAWGNKRGV